MCGVVFASFIGATILSNIAQWIHLHHQAAQLQGKVLQAYQQIFPGATEILEPHFRVDALLKQLTEAARGSEFAELLSVTGKTLLDFPRVHLQSLQFEDRVLSLTLQAEDITDLTNWLTALRGQPVTFEQEVTTTKNQVSAVIKVRSKESS